MAPAEGLFLQDVLYEEDLDLMPIGGEERKD